MDVDELIYIKGRKSVGILIKDGRVIVRAPKGISAYKLGDILAGKENWVAKKLREHSENIETNRDYIEYKRFLLAGRTYESFGALMEEPALLSGLSRSQYLQLRRACGPTGQNTEKAYRKLAAFILPESLKHISAEYGLGYTAVKLIKSKSKWGSCSAKGVISLNWRLIMLPETIKEYVIIHELCHITHLDHSKNYWETVQKYYPGYKKAREYLKKNNFIIKLY